MKKIKIAMVFIGIIGLFVAGIMTWPGATQKQVSAADRAEDEKQHKIFEYKKLAKEWNEKNLNKPVDPAITDTVAKIGFLRFLGDTLNPEHREKMKRYLGLVYKINNPQDQEKIVSKAEQFTAKSKELDLKRIAAGKDKAKADKFKEENDKAAKDSFTSLNSVLSNDGKDKLSLAMSGRVKQKIQLIKGGK